MPAPCDSSSQEIYAWIVKKGHEINAQIYTGKQCNSNVTETNYNANGEVFLYTNTSKEKCIRVKQEDVVKHICPK